MRNDAISVVSKLAASPNNVFTRSQAADHGLTRRHLRDAVALGAVQEVHPGVFLGGAAPPTWLQLVAAAGAAAPEAAASHRCSGRLHRLDGQTAPVVELSIAAPRQVRLVGVVGHRVQRLDPRDLVLVRGIRCTNLARTLCDLGSVCPADVVERAFDDVVRRGASVRWLGETAERLQRPGQAGPGLVLHLLDRFEQRGVVRDSWFEGLIAGEASDEQRDNAVGRLGWDVMYIGYGDLRSPAAVLGEVLGRVRARRRQLGVAC